MQEWTAGLYALGGAILGALGVIVGQWLNAKYAERTEYARWDQEKAKEGKGWPGTGCTRPR